MKKTDKKKYKILEAEAIEDLLLNEIDINSVLIPSSVGGLYTMTGLIPIPTPTPFPNSLAIAENSQPLSNIVPAIALPREELRVDVDGLYPQMMVSGTIFNGITERIHWIANVTKTGLNKWEGSIWYKNGVATAMPYTRIILNISNGHLPAQRTAKVTYSGSGLGNSVKTYKFASPYFHPVEFEFDSSTGVEPQTSINTCDHPNRPASLGCENLTIEKVFQRAGFEVKNSGGNGSVPLTGAGANATWSDSELHDAMQTFWSKFANQAQWSMWVFFAALHDAGTGLGGIMFDDIGPNHRQGTAMFNDSFIANAPAGDPDPAAWVRRMRFWTICHEMGHAFNLAHSWQKSLGTPWLPLADEPEARSFMNYPFRVLGGPTAFFADFMFRFSDNELKFLRHAPARFVQQGNADWFDNHGFQQAAISPEPTYKLEVRANRERAIFEFLEPVVLELKLTNTSVQPQIIEEKLLSSSDKMTVIIKKQGRPARQWLPFAQYCFNPAKTVLNINDSVYDSLFLGVGTNGWDLAEPGVYTIQIALHLENEDIVSAPLKVRIAPPAGFEEEFFAQDFFSEDVGRILAFDGSQALEKGNVILQEASERFADKRVAVHAQVALGSPLTRDYKLLSVPDNGENLTSVEDSNGKIIVHKAQPELANKEISTALFSNSNESAETLGHVDYKNYVDQLTNFVSEDNTKAAAEYQSIMYETLSSRGVLKRVLDEIDDYKNTSDPSKKKTSKK